MILKAKMKKFLLILLLTSTISTYTSNNNDQNSQLTFKSETLDQNNKKIKINIKLENESIYLKSINISTNNPNIELSKLEFDQVPNKVYDPIFKETEVFNKDFSINFVATKINDIEINNFELFISYLSNKSKNPTETLLTIEFDKSKDGNENIALEKSNNNQDLNCPVTTKKTENKSYFWSHIQKFSNFSQNLITKSSSTPIRLIFIFILGILMSLTPCIYPMVPITVGILQSQGSKSFWRNLLISTSYTLGIALTFATFGLTAALTGNIFGKILIQPWFIIPMVILLGYLALSMFGLYDMYVPKFLNNSNSTRANQGSIAGAFIFGAISGSVASPCLSPGLALLLSIVATLGSKLLGFIFLFTFGIGLSVPLLIIGLFSSSINFLPKSGMWMIEIKKLFGFMLFGMCFYFLNNILPYSVILWMASIFLLGSGIYYLKSINTYDSRFWKATKNILSIFMISFSIFVFSKAIQETFYPENQITASPWLKNYEEAISCANQQNKKLIIDIGASFCTLCHAIDKKIFGNTEIQKSLENFVLLKVDATDTNSQPYKELKEKYKDCIQGVPTILIINTQNDQLLKCWRGELYDLSQEQVIEELDNLNSKS